MVGPPFLTINAFEWGHIDGTLNIILGWAPPGHGSLTLNAVQ